MLANIDQLYNAILSRSVWDAYRGDSDGDAAHDAFAPSPPSQAPPKAAVWAAAAATLGGEVDGEELLHSIDQLYAAYLGGGKGEATEVGEQPRAPELVQEACPGLREDLEETLWSALLLQRRAAGRVDVEASFLRLLPRKALSQSLRFCGSAGLAGSLLHRLEAELPRLHAALIEPPVTAGASADEVSIVVRAARDGLLALAGSPEVVGAVQDANAGANGASAGASEAFDAAERSQADEMSSQGQTPSGSSAHTKQPRKATRRTSLSHWTSSDLEAMEAPPPRVAKRLAAK